MDRRPSPWVADILIAVGLFVISVIGLAEYAELPLGDLFQREPDALAYVLVGLQTLPLALRRRAPIAVLLVVLATWMVDRGLDYPSTLAGASAIVAVHAVGSELDRRRSAIVGGSVIGLVTLYTVGGAILYESVGLEDAAVVGLTGALALYLGREVHARRAATRSLTERAERAEADREARAAAAVAEERSRIARELHDVVAHQMVVMTVQAEGAARLAGDADPRVQEALGTIRDTGREGLAEMRRMVGLLREDGVDGLSPQPGLDRLAELADQLREAGLPVSVEISGEPRRLPGGVDLSAYRIVQESLTNALKHGGPDVTATVRLDYGDDRLDIRVTDDGRGQLSPSTNGGHGIVGMRERTAIHGGRLTTGNHPGGGFEVRATLPVDA